MRLTYTYKGKKMEIEEPSRKHIELAVGRFVIHEIDSFEVVYSDKDDPKMVKWWNNVVERLGP